MRKPLVLVLGVAMLGLGAFIALRPLWAPGPITQSRVLDLVFAALFLVRGYMNVRAAMRPRRPLGPHVPRNPEEPNGPGAA